MIGVFALKNVVLSDSEKYEMERKGFKVWDNDFFAYSILGKLEILFPPQSEDCTQECLDQQID